MKNLLSILGLAAMLVAGVPGVAAEKTADDERLAVMSNSAKTAVEHAKVAKEYRLRAEAFETQAAKHEAEMSRLRARPQLSFEGKWPAMSPKSWERERSLAMQARRAAQENFELADRHIRLSVEAQHAE